MPAPDGVALCEELLVGRLRERRAQGAGTPDPSRCATRCSGTSRPSRRAAAAARSLLDEFDFTMHMGLYAGDIGVSELIGRDLDRAEFELRRGHEVLVADR